jgi:hypothetical protein
VLGWDARGREESAGVVRVARELAVGRYHLTGALPCYHDHWRDHYHTLTSQLSPPACAREKDESVRVDLVTGEVAVGEHLPIKVGATAVSVGGTMH